MVTTVLSQNAKLKLELEYHPTEQLTVLRPDGVIDEDVNFSVVLEGLRKVGAVKCMRFDLKSVSRINSCGVREWILLVEKLSGIVPLEFENINEHFLDQANMVTSLLGRLNSRIVSFYAPYHCGACQQDYSLLLRPEQVQVKKGQVTPPEVPCPKCKKALKFDWLPEEYFSFLFARGKKAA